MTIRLFEHFRNAGRIVEISRVAMRYGFQQAVLEVQRARRGLFQRWRLTTQLPDPELARMNTGERMRRMLEELGPTFVKLGQLLSTRRDLVPDWVASELAQLQDHVAPMPFDQVRRQVETSLGDSLEHLYKTFDEEPLGSASMGQVHRAVMFDGSEVAVKVHRPGIEKLVQRDLSVLADIADMIDGRLPFVNNIHMKDVVAELSERLMDELVYTTEARNAERGAESLQEDDHIRIPRVYWTHTNATVFTMSLFRGRRLNDAMDDPAPQKKIWAERLAGFTLRCIFIDGFFHADPHPGNLMVFDNGDLGIIDWGQVGGLSRRMRESLDEMFISMSTQDTERLAAEIVRLGLADDVANLERYRADLSRMIDRYFQNTREAVPLVEMLGRALELSFEHSVQLPSELPLLVKVMVTIEATCGELDPQFDLRKQIEPVAHKLVGKQLDPEQMARTLMANTRQTTRFVAGLPRQLAAILEHVESGTMQLRISADTKDATRRIGQGVNRLSLAGVAVGLLVSGALLIPVAHAWGLTTFFAGLTAVVVVLVAILTGERL